MTKNLKLVTTENFGEVACDFYKDTHDEILMTREQIGQALGYSNPINAIKKIHFKHKDRLDALSIKIKTPTIPSDPKLGTVENLMTETTYYSERGVMEICRWSRQPKANDFMDWCYDVVQAYRRGQLVPNAQIVSDVLNAVTAMQATMQAMQEQSTQQMKLLQALLDERQAPRRYKSSYTPVWFRRVKPKLALLRKLSFPDDSNFSSTYALIFSEFNKRYGGDVLAQTREDFCERHNCDSCYTMDAVARSPKVRAAVEVIIDSLLEAVNEEPVDDEVLLSDAEKFLL